MNTLYVSVKGATNKPALIFLHGFMGSSSDWGILTEALCDHYYCVCIDLPGHGMSQRVEVNTKSGFAQTHKLIEQTIKRLGIKNYALIGYSLGGRIAMYHACKNPTGLQALLLESANPGLEDEQNRLDRIEKDAYWASRMRQEPFAHMLNDWYRQPLFANLSDYQRQEQIIIKSQYQAKPLASMLEATSLGRQDDLSAKLATLSLPIALLSGQRDTKFTEINEHLARQLKRVSALTFDKAGHNIHFEQPEAYAARLRQTLDQIYC